MEIPELNSIDYHRIVNLSVDLICIAGMDGYFKYVNSAWENILGYTRDELLSRPFLDFIHPDDHAKNDEEVEKLAAGDQTIDFENRYLHQDGSIRHIQWTATPVADEKKMYCIGRDITERKRAEEELRKSEKRFRTIADFTYDWETWIGPDGKYIYVSPSCERIQGMHQMNFLKIIGYWGPLLIRTTLSKSLYTFASIMRGLDR